MSFNYENNNHKNRGMLLESIINKAILIYKENEIGIFHKKELSIGFSNIENIDGKLKVNNGFIKKKSTSDYYGIYKGLFISFEAKSTLLDHLPMSNIKNHQFEYLKEISFYGGIGFLIISFSSYDEFYAIDINKIDETKTKITRIEAKEIGILLELIYPGFLDFIPAIEKLK